MDLQLRGKHVLVTAASKGIGKAVAQRLAAEGATVAVASRTVSEADKQEFSSGGCIVPFKLDLSNKEDIDQFLPILLDRFGKLDIAVLNTPGPTLKPILQTELSDWQAAFDLLVRPAVQLALASARHMAQNKSGSIVFLTSSWVRQPAMSGGLSASMRSVLGSLSKQMALELGPEGIRVNQVQPGATGTDRMANIVKMKAERNGTTSQQEIDHVIRDIPLGRWAEPEEIACAVAYLVSPLAGFITGATLQVDGGAIRSV